MVRVMYQNDVLHRVQLVLLINLLRYMIFVLILFSIVFFSKKKNTVWNRLSASNCLESMRRSRNMLVIIIFRPLYSKYFSIYVVNRGNAADCPPDMFLPRDSSCDNGNNCTVGDTCNDNGICTAGNSICEHFLCFFCRKNLNSNFFYI